MRYALRRKHISHLLPAVLLLVPACGGEGAEAATRDEAPISAPQHVDSVRPIDEEFRRFTADLGEPPVGLAGGAESLQALGRAFLRAVAERDTAGLRRLHLDRAEFAFLYYPTAPVSKPPYEMPPGLLWFQIEGISTGGVARLLDELGGREMRLDAVECTGAERQGENVLHSACLITYVRPDGERVTQKLFGNVLERGGRFKLVSYATDLD